MDPAKIMFRSESKDIFRENGVSSRNTEDTARFSGGEITGKNALVSREIGGCFDPCTISYLSLPIFH